MYINYCSEFGLRILSYANPRAALTDLVEVAEAASIDSQETLACSLSGDERHVLEDGAFWSQYEVTQDVLEELHDLVQRR